MAVGVAVGERVGDAEGASEGTDVGPDVGASVGAAVGAFVGAAGTHLPVSCSTTNPIGACVAHTLQLHRQPILAQWRPSGLQL